MSDRAPLACDSRVLVLTPTSKDAAVTCASLQSAGVACEICPTFDAVVRELRRGAAAVLIPEEALSPANNRTLSTLISEQPPWSDLPVLVLTRAGAKFGGVGRSQPYARQRHAARASAPHDDAAERGADGAARSATAVSDSRAP